MIEKVNGCRISYIPFKSGSNVIPVSTPVFVQNKQNDDVRYNFTFKINNTGIPGEQILSGKSKIEGTSYGINYELNRKSSSNSIELNGKIGDKPVKIKYKKNNIFSFNADIEGYVGDKKVQLKERNILNHRRLRGNFGSQEISLSQQHTRYDELITGKGVDMALMYYNTPKYVGEYHLDPEFLPILAGLYRYM